MFNELVSLYSILLTTEKELTLIEKQLREELAYILTDKVLEIKRSNAKQLG